MKVYKSKPNEYGWYWVIHQNKDGSLKIFKKSIFNSSKNFEEGIQIWGDGLKLLKKNLKKKLINVR